MNEDMHSQNDYRNMNIPIDTKEILRQQALNQFKPVLTVGFNKDYTVYITITILLLITLQGRISSAVGLWFLTFIFSAIETYLINSKLYRQGYTMTVSCCLAADTIAFLISAVWLTIINNKNVILTVSSLLFILIFSGIAQIFILSLFRRKERKQLNDIKNIEKQRQRYENKINKIFKYK